MTNTEECTRNPKRMLTCLRLTRAQWRKRDTGFTANVVAWPAAAQILKEKHGRIFFFCFERIKMVESKVHK